MYFFLLILFVTVNYLNFRINFDIF
jgi:hypothetical protein